MKNASITLLVLFFSHLVSGQIYERNNRKVVFTDQANVRENASIHAKVIGTLKQGEVVIVCDKTHILDTINGVISNWVPVLYNDNSAYIWGNTLAANHFNHIEGNRLLVKNDAKGLTYKIFAGDSLIGTGTHPDKPYENYYSYFYPIEPLDAVKNNLYFKLSESDIIYAFDGNTVVQSGLSKKENISSIHQSAQEEIKDSLGSIINRDKVNLRSGPSTDSKIIGQVAKYAFVEIIEKQKKHEKINDEYNYWYKIRSNGKVGYVWGKSLANPMMHIYDNDDKNTTYLLCNNALFVLYKGEIVASHIDEWNRYDETVHSFGDLGFGQGYDFVAIESMAHSCGEWGGDAYYLWDGKTLKYFCSSGGVGDGGLSEGTSYIFPSSPYGIPGKLIKNSYSSEMVDVIPLNDCEEKYLDVYDFDISSVMSYNGDTLIEVASKHLDLKQFIQREYPKYKLIQYQFADINADSIEDVIFQARLDKSIKDYYGDEQYTYKNKIGIAFGSNKGTWEIVKVNEHIGDGKARFNIKLKGSNILITTYPQVEIYESGGYALGRKMFEFVYNSTDQNFFWESITIIDNKGLRKSAFKTKKVLFEDAWDFVEEESNSDEGY